MSGIELKMSVVSYGIETITYFCLNLQPTVKQQKKNDNDGGDSGVSVFIFL